MFHWICPECGREIAPTVRECPACDPVAATVESALAGEVEAPARATNESVAVAREVEVPAARLAPTLETPMATPTPAASPMPVAAPDPEQPPALASHLEPIAPRAAQNSHRTAEREAGEVSLPQFGSGASGDPLDHLAAMLDSMEPEPPLSAELRPMAVPAIPPSLRAFIAELGPAGAHARQPVTPPVEHRRPAPEPPLVTQKIRLRVEASPQALAQPLGAKLMALPAQPDALARPGTPVWEPAPLLAPLGDYSPLAEHPLQPSVPQVQVLKKECGPRTTLPGPMLTRRLVKFMDRELTSIPPGLLHAKKPLIPGWMASALIIGTLLGAGLTSVVSLVRPAADAKQTPVKEVETAAPAPARAATVSPLAKAIEVTGFRIQMDPAKSEIQYLVVNHTPSRFNGVTVYVTLYAADAKAGQPPLCRFQFAAPNLGPYQSKDMTSTIQQVTRPVTLPDWQDMRATVEIGQ